jgi:hypothetical protein
VRASSIFILAAAWAATAFADSPVASAPSRDPYDPVSLQAQADGFLARGDRDTAWILLERAARLAPHDPLLAARARALREGAAVTPGSNAAPLAGAAPAAALRIPPEPPPLWPAR